MPAHRNYTALAGYYHSILGAGYDYPALARYLRALIDRFSPRPERMPAQADSGTAPLRAAADAVAIPFKPGFDVCLMLMDAINYPLHHAALEFRAGEFAGGPA